MYSEISLCHEDVLGSGDIARRILNLGTRWRWLASFTPQALYPGERAPGTHWIGGWVGPRAGLNAVAKRNNTYHYRESKPGRPAHSSATILPELPRLLHSPDLAHFSKEISVRKMIFLWLWTESLLCYSTRSSLIWRDPSPYRVD
jgi:hypothetical protein